MAMTPEEIREQSFPSVRKGGLDPEAVADFLTHIADEVVRLQDDAEQARVALTSAPPVDVTPIAAPPAAEPPRTIVGSRVDELLDAAQRSADGIVTDAEVWATDHKAKADTYAQEVRSKVDDLRQTTEAQAESFREETVEYANKIREDAEAASAQARTAAESDLNEQYERLVADVSSRLDAVQTAEQELLSQLTVTQSAIHSATAHFQSAVENHADATISRDAAHWDELSGTAPVTADPSPAAVTEPEVAEYDAAEYSADADDVYEPWVADSGVEDAGEESPDDGPEWPPSADDADKPVDQWESTSDTPELADASDQVDTIVDPWAAESVTDPWEPAADSGNEADSASDWAPTGPVETWQTEQPSTEQPSTEQPPSLATAEAWDGATSDGRASFFTSSAESESPTPDDDPLSTMVREAVERVTDGHGNN